MVLDIGEVIGTYRIEELIGEGGQALVYRVSDVGDGSVWALKLLQRPTPGRRSRMQREGEMQASLRHPNVVEVHEVLDVDGAPGLVMELVAGPDLNDLLREGIVPKIAVDQLAQGIMAGVKAAHDQGLVHRDLKPSNVLLRQEDGRWLPLVTDFGLVKQIDGPQDPLTRTGVQMGTPAYMSPEQIRDTKHVDHRTDVFALGAMLYELWTGIRAFDAGDVYEVFQRVNQGDYHPPERCRPGLPEPWAKAIEGALVVDLERRIPDVGTMLAVWRGEQDWVVAPRSVAQERQPVAATLDAQSAPSGSMSRGDTIQRPPEPNPRPSRGRSWLQTGLLSLFGLGVGVLGAGGMVLWIVDRPEAPLADEPASPPVEAPLAEPEPPAEVEAPSAAPPSTAPSPRRVATASQPESTPEVEVQPPPVDEPSVGTRVEAVADPRSVGTVVLGGDRPDEAWLLQNGRRTPVGAVAPGTYTLMAVFKGLDPREAARVTVVGGERVLLECDGFFHTCEAVE